jgi:hypothetical protein
MSTVEYTRNVIPPFVDKKVHGVSRVALGGDGALTTYKDSHKIAVLTNGAAKAETVPFDASSSRLIGSNVYGHKGKTLYRYNVEDKTTTSLTAPANITETIVLRKYVCLILAGGQVVKCRKGTVGSLGFLRNFTSSAPSLTITLHLSPACRLCQGCGSSGRRGQVV